MKKLYKRHYQLEDREDLIKFLAEDAKSHRPRKFQLDKTYFNSDREYQLNVIGTRGKFYGPVRYEIPAEIGAELAKTWKVSKWGTYVGGRSSKRLLEELGVPTEEIEKYLVEREERFRKNQREMRARQLAEYREEFEKFKLRVTTSGFDIDDVIGGE